MTTKDIQLDNYFVKDGALVKVIALTATKINTSLNPGDLTPIPSTAAVLLAAGFILDGAVYRCPYADYIAVSLVTDKLHITDYVQLPLPDFHTIQGIIKRITLQGLTIDEEALKDAALGTDLVAPVVTLTSRTSTTFVLGWAAVAHAVGYQVSIDDGVTYGETQVGLTFTKADATAATTYPVKVKAMAGESTVYRDSYPGSLSVLTLEVLATISDLATDGVFDTKFTVDWGAIAHAAGYRVSTDNGATYGEAQAEVSFTKEDAVAETTYQVKVKAVAEIGSDYEDGLPSAALEVITIATTPLDAPAVTLTSKTSTGFVVEWPAVAHATGYKVSIDDGVTYGDAQVGLTFTKTDATPTTEYNVKVIADATPGTGYSDSVASAGVEVITLTPLASPVLTEESVNNTGFGVSWLAIANASGYQVSIDGGTTWSETQVGITFTKADATETTEYEVQVKAIGETIYEDSPASETLVITTKTSLGVPQLTVGTVTATSFSLSWVAIANAAGYQVSIDNGATYGTTQVGVTYEKLDATPSTEYLVKVKAMADPEGDYVDSAASAALDIDTPAE